MRKKNPGSNSFRETTRAGLEPATSAVTGRRSNQLNQRALKADDRTRTDNLLITNQLLCQLSHIGLLTPTGIEPVLPP